MLGIRRSFWAAVGFQGKKTMHCRQQAMSIAALCVGLGFHGAALAQSFFVTYSSLDVASCDSTHLQGSVTASYVLPATSNNLVAFVSINGGPQIMTSYTQNPATFSGPFAFFYPIPVTAQPYTIAATVLPGQNGTPTGSGVSASFTCNLDGTVTSVFAPAAAPSAAVATPTLSEIALTALALLLGGLAMRRLRRGV
jgi:hypothetical protein